MSQNTADLDMQIMEALHIDGRASWNRIAQVLDVNERTVARRGNALLASGAVRVVAVAIPSLGHVTAFRCGQGQARMTSRALSQHDMSHWTHVTTGDVDVVAEVTPGVGQQASALLEELPAVAGIRDMRVYPIIEYLRLAGWWNLRILNDAQRTAMRPPTSPHSQQHIGTTEHLSDRDQSLLQTLRTDGRTSYEELGRRIGTSDVTAKHRLDALRRDGIINIRSIIDPVALGLETEVLTWLEVPPRHVQAVAEGIKGSDQIKYASQIAGPWNFLVKTHVPDRRGISDALPDEPWVDLISRTSTSVVLRTDKRSTVPTFAT